MPLVCRSPAAARGGWRAEERRLPGYRSPRRIKLTLPIPDGKGFEEEALYDLLASGLRNKGRVTAPLVSDIPGFALLLETRNVEERKDGRPLSRHGGERGLESGEVVVAPADTGAYRVPGSSRSTPAAAVPATTGSPAV